MIEFEELLWLLGLTLLGAGTYRHTGSFDVTMVAVGVCLVVTALVVSHN